jgi:hypothetical protein
VSAAGPGAFEGGCLCGDVRYRAQGPAANPTLCHCASCRRASGAPAVAWVSFEAAGFAFVRGAPVRYRSSPRVVRSFCGRCGTPLTYAHDGEPQGIDVTTASLDAPGAVAPADHTWTAERLAWLRTADGLPEFPGRRGDGPQSPVR